MINMLGTDATFEILNVMEYSSARGRMSVIARSAEGGIRLLSKGSDSKVMRILGKGVPKALLDATNQNLHLFATQVSSSAQSAAICSVPHTHMVGPLHSHKRHLRRQCISHSINRT